LSDAVARCNLNGRNTMQNATATGTETFLERQVATTTDAKSAHYFIYNKDINLRPLYYAVFIEF